MKIRIYGLILMIIILYSCSGLESKNNLNNLIENYPIEVSWGALLHEWSDEFKDVDTIIVKPPYLQIIYQHSINDYLIERIYDYSKRKLIKNKKHTGLHSYFKIRFKEDINNKIKKFEILPFKNGYEDEKKIKHEISNDFSPFINFKEIYARPTKLNIREIDIYITENCTFRDENSIRNYYYFQFFIRTKKGVISIKKWIEPKEKRLDFPPPLESPLNNKKVDFLVVDIDGNGIDELITAAQGPEHNRHFFYYNIFNFDKLIDYLEKNNLVKK